MDWINHQYQVYKHCLNNFSRMFRSLILLRMRCETNETHYIYLINRIRDGSFQIKFLYPVVSLQN